MATFPGGVASKPTNITDGLQILAGHVGTLWDEVIAVESELTGAGAGAFFLDIRPSTAGSVIFQSRQLAGDTQPRFQITGTGDHRWGSGSAATDITLARSAARILSLAGSQVINIANLADTGLLIKGIASQSGLLLDLQDSGAVSKFSVSVAGVVTTPTVNASSAMTAPTLAPGTNTTGVATTAFVGTAVATATAGALPPGVVVPYAASLAPAGYLLCDGSSQLRASFANLFAVIGVTWGSADGTHFNVPDLRGRTIVGVGTGAGLSARTLAATGGEETHVLSVGELASHDHGGATGAAVPTGTIGSTTSTGSTTANPANGTVGNEQSHIHDVGGGGVIADLQNSITLGRSGAGVSPTRFSYEGTAGTGVVVSSYSGTNAGTQGVTTPPMSAHTHSFTPTNHSHGLAMNGHTHTFVGDSQTHTITAQGSSTGHNNMQPFMALSYVIKT